MEANIKVSWKNGFLSQIETPHLILRPIKETDISSYVEIFNETAMKSFRGSFTENRFNTWLTRWKSHNFSALAIVDKTTEKAEVIGHAILGHGDYEGTVEKGWTKNSLCPSPSLLEFKPQKSRARHWSEGEIWTWR